MARQSCIVPTNTVYQTGRHDHAMNTKKHTTTKAQRRQAYRENAQREREEERYEATKAYGLKMSHDGTLYIGGLLQLPKWARRHPLGAKQARGGKVTVTPMI